MRFDTINGQLCIMLEKPVPLTPDAKFPCVVRLIQDDSQMGKYNKRLADGGRLPFVCNGIKESHIQKDGKSPYFEYAYECYEILGYPVADGSAGWALWQMQQGNYVIHEGLNPCNIHCEMVTWLDSPESKHFTMQPLDKWLLYCPFNNGWQLYEPKPLLADAKVGDLCQRSNGRYTQFHSKHKLKNGSIAYYFTDASGSTDIDGNHCIHECGNNIVSCEPLATEGTAEWAWQMWCLLGKEVAPKNTILTERALDDEYPMITHIYGHDAAYWKDHKDKWLILAASCKWELSKPETCPTCNGTGKGEKPAPAFKVGDWVRGKSGHDYEITSYPSKLLPNNPNVYDAMLASCMNSPSVCLELSDITRKLSPSEVVVDFGSGIKGWICYHSYKINEKVSKYNIDVFSTTNQWLATLAISALDTSTRELVLELISRQEEEE